MIPHTVDGASPRGAATHPQGFRPQPPAAARERLRELGELFTARIQQSMVESLAALTEDAEAGSADEGGDVSSMGGLDATFGASGLGDPTLAQAGAGSEAALARQLLAAASAAGVGAGIAGTGRAPAAAPAAVAAAPAGSSDARTNARVVAQVAREQGVDPVAAVAMMLVESGGNAGAVGDGGTSFGLFQLHEGGMLTAAGLTPQQAYDPRTNATVSLRALAHETRQGPNRSPGEIAAASQRPADPAGYARKVDAAMERARALLR